ncbi:MAG: diguanylate cyclase [Oscillospiraceae bacterium]|nr:diguanylate cyclase [Oscillospiraceae bacterium]
MDNKALHDKFRHQFTNVHGLTVLTVSVFEIIGYIVLILSGEEFFSLRNHYLWYGVVFPVAVNAATHLVARWIVRTPNVSRGRKNASIVIAALITSFVVAVIHRAYIVTSCAFIFPIILSAMFNDRKLLNFSFGGSVFILISVGFTLWFCNEISLDTAINLFVLFGFLLVSYFCGIISVNFSRQNYTTIESQAEENSKLLEDVLRDQMTGLYNHNAFVTRLDQLMKTQEGDFCLMMVDVDNFKSINDTYGHDCGDTVLIQLAKTLQKHCGKNDTAYRYGGEEFAVLFVGKSEKEALKTGKSMLEEFRNHSFPFTDRVITFSAGLARYAPDTTREEFFELADRTLYAAKGAGKNRIMLSEK